VLQTIVTLTLAGFVLGLLGHFLLRRPCNLRVVVRQGRVQLSGPILANRQGSVVEFFKQDLPEVRYARVEGFWDGRRLELRFAGELSAGQRQRIRNFLLHTL
jgi:hypothetical protein